MLRVCIPPARPVLATLTLCLCAAGALAQDDPRPPSDVPTLAQLFGQPGPSAPSQPNATDLVVRLNQLEGQVRQLNGQLEQMQYRNQQLEQALRRMQEEADGRGAPRPGAVAPSRPVAAAPVPGGAPVGVPPSPGRRSDVFDPGADPNAPGAPRPLGSSGPTPPPVSAGPVGVPGGREPGQPLDITTLGGRPPVPDLSPPPGLPSSGRNAPVVAPAPTPGPQAALPAPSGSAREDYDRSYNAVLRQDYEGAESGFRAFLQTYPRDRLTPNATYWLGESLFQRQRWREAAEHYLKVSTAYPNAQVAPNSLLRLGQSLLALGEREAACATFGEGMRKYPNAPQSVRQGLDQEQRKARC